MDPRHLAKWIDAFKPPPRPARRESPSRQRRRRRRAERFATGGVVENVNYIVGERIEPLPFWANLEGIPQPEGETQPETLFPNVTINVNYEPVNYEDDPERTTMFIERVVREIMDSRVERQRAAGLIRD